MIDNYAKPEKGGKFVVDAWILFQLSSLEPLSPSPWGSLLLFLAFCSQPAPESSSPERRRSASWLPIFFFLANNLFRWLASNLDYWEGCLGMILLIIFPSSWSLPTTHLGGVERKQSEQRGRPQNPVRWKISRSHCRACVIPLQGSANSFHPLDLPTKGQTISLAIWLASWFLETHLYLS